MGTGVGQGQEEDRIVNFLLDTHIWLWMLLEPENLNSNVHSSLKDWKNRLFLSPVSVWELSLLVEKGYMTFSEGINAWVTKSQKELDLREAPFTIEVAARLRETHSMHRDPADRLLVATARAYDLTLVTADRKLHAPIQGLDVLENR
jgi:PIN domain nuclease of toxin-antitoxin system